MEDRTLPKRLRNGSAEEIAAYRVQRARKGAASKEEARQLFRQRMELEGRLEEYLSRIEAGRTGGKSRLQAVYAAMREMGYAGATKERKAHRHALAAGRLDRWRLKQSQRHKRYRRKMQQRSLMEEFNELPNNAPNSAEMAWVRSHPLMMQALLARLQATGDDEPELPVPGVEDMVSASNGDCPSKSAWTMLLAWLKDPKKLQEQLIPEQRKGSDKAGGAKEDENDSVVDDLSDVERMIKAASG